MMFSKISKLDKYLIVGLGQFLSVSLGFLLTLVVTWGLDIASAGLFFLAFTTVTIISTLIRLGIDNYLLKSFSRNDSDSLEILNRSIIWVFSISFCFVTIAYSLSEMICDYVFNKPQLEPILIWMLPAIPCLAVARLVSVVFQSHGKVIYTLSFQTLLVSLLFVFLCVLVIYIQGYQINSIELAKIYSFSCIVNLCISLKFLKNKVGVRFFVPKLNSKEMAMSYLNFWIPSSLTFTFQFVGTLIAGKYLAEDEFSVLSVTSKIAGLLGFILVFFNLLNAKDYPQLSKDKKNLEIERKAVNTTRMMILLVIPSFISICLLSDFFLGFFGDAYTNFGVILILYSIGHLVSVGTGQVGILLYMTGNEKYALTTTLVCLPIVILCSFYLIINYGLLGAAIASSISLSIQNLMMMVFVRIRLGFWTMNVFRKIDGY